MTFVVVLSGLFLPISRAFATAEGIGALRASLAREMALAGAQSGAYVYDASARRLLFQSRGDTPHPPASVEKLYTSTTALVRFGPAAQLPTTVLGVGSLDAAGVWHGNLYLHGGGDPTFGTTAFINATYGSGQGASDSQLANALRRAGVRKVTGRLLGDESLFDALRGGPTTNYATDPEVEGVLSALAFNRGASRPGDRSARPGRLCRADARRRSARRRHLGRRWHRDRHRAAGGDPPRRRRLAAAGHAAAPHGHALGQLLRRDARQGHRRLLRRRGDDERPARPS